MPHFAAAAWLFEDLLASLCQTFSGLVHLRHWLDLRLAWAMLVASVAETSQEEAAALLDLQRLYRCMERAARAMSIEAAIIRSRDPGL